MIDLYLRLPSRKCQHGECASRIPHFLSLPFLDWFQDKTSRLLDFKSWERRSWLSFTAACTKEMWRQRIFQWFELQHSRQQNTVQPYEDQARSQANQLKDPCFPLCPTDCSRQSISKTDVALGALNNSLSARKATSPILKCSQAL